MRVTRWTVCGGVEHALTRNWSLKGDYLTSPAEPKRKRVQSRFPDLQTTNKLNVSILRFGLNHKFDLASAVAAKY